MLRLVRCVIPIILLFVTLRALAQPASQPITQPASQPIPAGTLVRMYQRELGPLYHEADVERLLGAHALLERFFAATTAAERKTITQALEKTEIDANILG